MLGFHSFLVTTIRRLFFRVPPPLGSVVVCACFHRVEIETGTDGGEGVKRRFFELDLVIYKKIWVSIFLLEAGHHPIKQASEKRMEHAIPLLVGSWDAGAGAGVGAESGAAAAAATSASVPSDISAIASPIYCASVSQLQDVSWVLPSSLGSVSGFCK